MKPKPEMDPAAAFPDMMCQPEDNEWLVSLGRRADPVKKILRSLKAIKPPVTMEWKFSNRAGWYQIHLLKKRRLFYLVPKREDYRVSLILGDKALADLKAGPFARRTIRSLQRAKRYPEGTAFSFDSKSLDPDLLAAFLAVKLAY